MRAGTQLFSLLSWNLRGATFFLVRQTEMHLVVLVVFVAPTREPLFSLCAALPLRWPLCQYPTISSEANACACSLWALLFPSTVFIKNHPA